MQREIVLDTETTGLDPDAGHRVVEVAALELVNHLPTGRLTATSTPSGTCRRRPSGSTGSARSSSPSTRFAEVVDPLLEFLQDSPLVIYNAAFDIRFLNAEFTRHGREPLALGRAVDSLLLAQAASRSAPNSLDALCRRFDVDNAAPHAPGPLLDCELLAEVYLHLIGGRQIGLGLDRPGGRRAPTRRRAGAPLPGPAARALGRGAGGARRVRGQARHSIWLPPEGGGRSGTRDRFVRG